MDPDWTPLYLISKLGVGGTGWGGPEGQRAEVKGAQLLGKLQLTACALKGPHPPSQGRQGCRS